jgi:hypothetical protein
VALAAALQSPRAMLVYRSFVVGLLGAACLLLAQRQRLEVRMLPAPQPVVRPVAHDDARIVDVSAQLTPAQLAQLLHVPVLDAPMPPPGGFLDLSIDGRRTLVLVH